MRKPQKLNKGDKVAIVSLSWGGLGDSKLIHKYHIAKERLERLKKENEQYLKDVEDEKLRSQEQISKINQAQKEIESKVEELRKKNMNNLSVDEQIAIIEAKKVALVELRESINTQIDYLNQNAQDEYERRIAYIDEEPLRKGELDSKGNIISSVKAKRDAEKKKIKNEIFSQTEKTSLTLFPSFVPRLKKFVSPPFSKYLSAKTCA